MRQCTRVLAAAIAVALAGCGIDTNEVAVPRLPLGGGGGAVAGETTFSAAVGPILLEHCSLCHNAASRTADVDLTSYDAVIASGVVAPGDPEGSLLMVMLDSGAMPPPGNPAPIADEIEAVRAWITAGALND